MQGRDPIVHRTLQGLRWRLYLELLHKVLAANVLGPGIIPVMDNQVWLVVLTILKNISQWEGLSHISWKINKV